MNLLKSAALTAFALFTALCVNYAHSQATGGKIYRSAPPAFMGGSCMLKIQQDGGKVEVTPSSFSGLQFTTDIPNVPGTFVIAIDYPSAQNAVQAGHPGRERLLLKLSVAANGEAVPLAYTWSDLTHGFSHDCFSLQLESVL
jgi:hypothetical protein